jgi:hypothetical protein
MVRMTEGEYAILQARRAGKNMPAKQPRVRNAQRVEVDGIVFDSKA